MSGGSNQPVIPNPSGGVTQPKGLESFVVSCSVSQKTKVVSTDKYLKKKVDNRKTGSVRKKIVQKSSRCKPTEKLSSQSLKSGLKVATKPLNQKTLVELWGQNLRPDIDLTADQIGEKFWSGVIARRDLED